MGDNRYKIVHEDDWLLVIDKPSGLLVIPTPKKEENTLTALLNRELDERGVAANAYPCHRLDRETSGLVIYAKGKKAQGLVMDEFKNRLVKKTYIAFVRGNVLKDSDTLKSAIYNRNKARRDTATTKYKVLERRKGFSVLEVEPVTGRTNQIRIHLARIGHPILGERVYAFGKDFEIKFKRVALHAAAIALAHPVTKEKLEFVSDLPSDMKNMLGGER